MTTRSVSLIRCKVCITYNVKKKPLRGQSKSKAYLVVRKYYNLYVIVILMEMLLQPTEAKIFSFIVI